MISTLTDDCIAELYSQAQEQGITGIEPSIHFARAIKKELLGKINPDASSPQRGAMRVPGFILTQWDDFNQKQRYFHSVVEMPEFGHTTVCPYTLEFDLPEGIDAKTAALEGIKTQQAALAADFAAKQQALELRLQEITGKPAD